MASHAPVLEVFRSIQGEGLHAGRPMVFLRLAGCPLRCRWCDTPGSWPVPAPGAERGARVEVGGRARRVSGSADARQALEWIEEVSREALLPVSATGGEPCLWPDFLLELAALLGGRGLHLETGGGHPRALGRLADELEHISLDLKLPEDLEEPVEPPAGVWSEPLPHGEEAWAEARRAALSIAAGRPAAAKVVVSAGDPARYAPLLLDLAEIAPSVPLFLQPVTPMGGAEAPARAELEELVDRALGLGLDLRVVPQIHRSLGVP